MRLNIEAHDIIIINILGLRDYAILIIYDRIFKWKFTSLRAWPFVLIEASRITAGFSDALEASLVGSILFRQFITSLLYYLIIS